MKILISGGSGVIGSHLSDKLKNLGHDITILDIVKPTLNTIEGIKFIDLDILNKKELFGIVDKIDCIYHLAAPPLKLSHIDPPQYKKNNLEGMLNLLELAETKKINRFIFAS